MIKKIALFGAIILFSFLLIYCTTDEEKLIGPFGDSDKYISIANFSADKTLLYSNGDTTVVKIKVLDIDNTPAIGLIVDFSTQFGSITEADTTDSSGTAFATFISGDNTGENIITADTGVKKHTLLLSVVHYQPRYVELFAESPMLLADGQDSTKINVTLKDSVGNPMSDVTVRFNTTLGTLKSKIGITNNEGKVTTVLISSTEDGTAFVTATSFVTNFIEVEMKKYVPFSLELFSEDLVLLADGQDYTTVTAIPRDANGVIMTNVPILFSSTVGTISSEAGTFSNASFLTANSGNSGREAIIYLTSNTDGGSSIVTASSYITSFVEIKIQKYVPKFLELSAGSPVILADGEKGTTITAVLKDSTGKRMEGESVRFSTTLGALSSSIELTDKDGIAEVILTSSTAPGKAFVTATSYITSFVEVEFSNNVPSTIDISAVPLTILADGVSTSTITAIPKEQDGKPMPGISIKFSTTLGTLSETIKITDSEGKATTMLTSGNTNGIAYVTATSSASSIVGVQVIAYNPTLIELTTAEESILADGVSEVKITAKVYDSIGNLIPGAVVDFSTNYGTLNDTTVLANQEGKAIVTLRSAGSVIDFDAVVTAQVQGTSLSETVLVRLRGISMSTYVDSVEFAEDGYYRAYIRTELIETSDGRIVEEAAVAFSSTIGIMQPEVDGTNEFGRAFSILSAEVTGADQSGLVVTAELTKAPEVNTLTDSRVIPGAEILVNTIDGDVMGDGVGWALVKATLRESGGNVAIPLTGISWSTTLGTIIGQSKTNTSGHTIDTLRIENSVSTNTNVTVTANFGDYISVSDILTFITPINNNRLIMGAEADTTGHGIIPCNTDTSLGFRDMGISADFVNSNGALVFPGQEINFSVVPNNLAGICPTDTTDVNSTANVMLLYPPQNEGEIVRIWSEAPDGTRGSIDIILRQEDPEEDGGG